MVTRMQVALSLRMTQIIGRFDVVGESRTAACIFRSHLRPKASSIAFRSACDEWRRRAPDRPACRISRRKSS